MTITLELPPDVEGALTREAERQGKTPEHLVLSDLRRLYPTLGDEEDQTQRHAALDKIIARAQALTPVPEPTAEDDPVGDAIAEKFRRQGFNI